MVPVTQVKFLSGTEFLPGGHPRQDKEYPVSFSHCLRRMLGWVYLPRIG